MRVIERKDTQHGQWHTVTFDSAVNTFRRLYDGRQIEILGILKTGASLVTRKGTYRSIEK